MSFKMALPHSEIAMVEDPTHSDTSSSDGVSVKEYGPNFNAPIYPPKWKTIHDRTWVVLTECAQIFYLLWRWHRFFKYPSSYWISVPMIVSETLIMVGGSFITYFLVWNQIERPQLRLHDLKIAKEDYPTVDVMIPCYNEPVEVSAKISM